MKYIVRDKKNHFEYAFNTETGEYIRTGVLDENGRDTGVDPFIGANSGLLGRRRRHSLEPNGGKLVPQRRQFGTGKI